MNCGNEMVPVICDVGPRDGLQNLKRIFSIAERVELVTRLAGAGARRIEAVSFVNPNRVPQMAEAEAVLDRLELPDFVSLAGLVMNERGLERALSTGLDEIRFVIVASETFSKRNQNSTIAESVKAFANAVPQVKDAGRKATAVIGASFGCPFEGEVPHSRVTSILAELADAGADEILLADTIGVAVPADVRKLGKACRDILKGVPLGYHFHNTRNTGYANALAAIECGASVLDASIGGIGGCPFAPRATGNIATEDLCYMMERSGYKNDLDFVKLVETANWLEDMIPAELAGQLRLAGAFPKPEK